MKLDFKGKRVLITAGAGGIGWATACAFAEAGARVHICDIDAKRLAAREAECPGLSASNTDVSKPDQVHEMFVQIERSLGGLDVLVNNAGIAGPTRPVDEITDAEWAETLNVNISGQFYCARGAVRLMKRSGGGAIVNISSTAGRMGMPLRLPYSTTKYAVRGLSDALAVELGEYGIRVNSVMPGLIDGPRGARVVAAQAEAAGIAPQDYLSAMLHNVSLHAMISAEEIASAVLFLASDHARHITGQSLGVCGNLETYRSPLSLQPREAGFTITEEA